MKKLKDFLEGQITLFAFEQEPLTRARFSRFLEDLLEVVEEEKQ